jgi:hypothetical protein
LIKQLGRTSSADIKAVLTTREKTEPETDLRADVVARVELKRFKRALEEERSGADEIR